jgi:hypothetical protein
VTRRSAHAHRRGGRLCSSEALLFEHERLDGCRLWICDPRYGTSWDDWSEEKQLALRDAHDSWLVEMLGPGSRFAWAGGSLPEYRFEWGEVWSSYDPRSGSSSIGVRFRARGA